MDDRLADFAANGASALPQADRQGHLQHDGAALWYASYSSGPTVVLLHGGLGNAGNWGNQVSALIDAGYRVIVTDSRGHGRSTTDSAPYHYNRLATDLLAIMDHLDVPTAALIGWSDGACTALELAIMRPERVKG
ncbi:MAG: alpha/beta hydrolase, partial [Alphaproteobacteria bacterium]|nr:alpha/beta hydrolase [Alphaproteobacteria bacterium]